MTRTCQEVVSQVFGSNGQAYASRQQEAWHIDSKGRQYNNSRPNHGEELRSSDDSSRDAMVQGTLTLKVVHRVLDDWVGKPEYPKQDDHQAYAREEEAGIGLDAAEEHASSKQQGRQHWQGDLHAAHHGQLSMVSIIMVSSYMMLAIADFQAAKQWLQHAGHVWDDVWNAACNVKSLCHHCYVM